LTDIDVRSPPVDFSGARIESCTLMNLDLSGLSFKKATVKHCWIGGTSFAGADFTQGKLVGCYNGNMAGARFHRANLKKVEFVAASLQGADFQDAVLDGANFLDAKLDGARFAGATLAGVEFLRASLVGTDFTGAQLDGAKLEGADTSKAVGFVAPVAGKKARADVYETVSSEGTPIVAVPQSLVAQWSAADLDRAMAGGDDVVTVADGVRTGSLVFLGARALVLDGELDTGGVLTDDGAVLIRGGDFDGEVAAAQKAVKKALKRKGWQAHAHALVLDAAGLVMFDSASAGAQSPEMGRVEVPLSAGRYAVRVLGMEGEGGPVVFIHLVRG
jgi:uncharacterized protein YjbI with pentapeptide repeats